MTATAHLTRETARAQAAAAAFDADNRDAVIAYLVERGLVEKTWAGPPVKVGGERFPVVAAINPVRSVIHLEFAGRDDRRIRWAARWSLGRALAKGRPIVWVMRKRVEIPGWDR